MKSKFLFGTLSAILLSAVLTLPRLQAQEGSVSMKVDLVAWGDSITGLSLKTADAKGAITALSFRYSDPVTYSGPTILEIHQSANREKEKAPELSEDDKLHQMMPLLPEDSATDGQKMPKQGLALELDKRREKSPTLVALAALPATGCRRATILLAPAEAGTFFAYVINDDPDKLPLGQMRVHNLSPMPVAMRSDGKAKELKTRETVVIPAKNGEILYELAYKLGEEWKMQENNILPVRENEQTQMIILKSNNRFFLSTDGSSGGFLQIVTLRRRPGA